MSSEKIAAEPKPTTVVVNDPDNLKGMLKNVGGSRSDHWNDILANQAMQALWSKNSSPEERDKQLSATLAALVGIRVLKKSTENRGSPAPPPRGWPWRAPIAPLQRGEDSCSSDEKRLLTRNVSRNDRDVSRLCQ